MFIKLKCYVDQMVKGKTITTQFDSPESAQRYALAVGGHFRKPAETASSTLADKLFTALEGVR